MRELLFCYYDDHIKLLHNLEQTSLVGYLTLNGDGFFKYIRIYESL